MSLASEVESWKTTLLEGRSDYDSGKKLLVELKYTLPLDDEWNANLPIKDALDLTRHIGRTIRYLSNWVVFNKQLEFSCGFFFVNLIIGDLVVTDLGGSPKMVRNRPIIDIFASLEVLLTEFTEGMFK